MRTPNKRELQQTVLNHSSDTDFQDFINLYKKRTAKPYSFWLLILLLNQIIIYVLERKITRKKKEVEKI